MMHDNNELNRFWWNEVTPHHLQSRFYDVEGFLSGKNTLLPLELAALGDVKNKRLLHLQCHIGLDTLSWARWGARVTGVDFSLASIEAARDLARHAGLEKQADFIEMDVLEWHKKAEPIYDIVITTYGILSWLRDLKPWALGIAASLKKGGIFYIAEIHPLADAVTWERGGKMSLRTDVLGDPRVEGVLEDGQDYATGHIVADGCRLWHWPLSTVLQCLLDTGLVLEKMGEYPYSCYEHYKGLVRGDDGYWRLPPGEPNIPLLFSLRMIKA